MKTNATPNADVQVGRRTWLTQIAAWGAASAALGLTACAGVGSLQRISAVQPGQTRAEVLALLGNPTAVVSMAGVNGPGATGSAFPNDPAAAERLQYSGQPFGQFANMVDLDAQGRVVRAFQALNITRFQAITARLQQTRLTQQDVLREFGPPAQTTAVSSWQGPIWLYRYYDMADMRYALYFDPEGVLRRGHPEMEERRRRFPNL